MVRSFGYLCIAAFLCVSTEAYGFDFFCTNFRPMFQDRQLERPRQPDCASTSYPFSDSYDFDSCKTEMEEYQSKLKGYLACLDSESKEAVSEYNQTVSAFNRRAQQ